MPNPEADRLAARYAAMNDGELELVAESLADLTGDAQFALRQELGKRGLSVPVFDAPKPPTPPPPPPDENSDLESWIVLKRFIDLTRAEEAKAALDAAGVPCRLANMNRMDWFIANVVGGVKLMVKPEDFITAQEVLDDAAPGSDPDSEQWTMLKRFRDIPEAMIAKDALDSAGVECHFTDDNMVRLDWFWSNLIGGVKLVVKTEDTEAAQQILNQPVPEQIEFDEGQDFAQPSCPKCGSFDVTFMDAAKGAALLALYVVALPVPIHSRRWKCEMCGVEWVVEPDPPHDAAAASD